MGSGLTLGSLADARGLTPWQGWDETARMGEGSGLDEAIGMGAGATMDWRTVVAGGWVALLFIGLFAIDLVALLQPSVVLRWLQQWMTWMNRLSRIAGIEWRIVDETRCRSAIRVVGVLYGGLLWWLVSLWR